MFGRRRLRPRLGDASSRDGCAAARFRAMRSVGDTVDRSHLCRSTWCPRLWRLNLGTCVCMHTWGGRSRPDVRVRSPREARPQVAAPPRAAGSIATAAQGLPPMTCSLHVAARNHHCGSCRLSRAHFARDITPLVGGRMPSCVRVRGRLVTRAVWLNALTSRLSEAS